MPTFATLILLILEALRDGKLSEDEVHHLVSVVAAMLIEGRPRK